MTPLLRCRFGAIALAVFVLVAGSSAVFGDAPLPMLGQAGCSGNAWVNLRCFGAVGNGTADDTAAINKAVRAALSSDLPLYLPNGRYKVTKAITIDYTSRADTGFRLISTGATVDGTLIRSGPVLEILCSGGAARSPKGCFYFKEEGTLFINANTGSYAVVIGNPDFSDAHNSIKIDHLIINNGNAGPRAGGLQLNYVLSSDIFAVAVTAGGAAGIALQQTQISRISGAGSASAQGGVALRIENGYNFANTIYAMDLEVAPTCIAITSPHAAHNTFISPYMACPTAINATAGHTTHLVNPLFAGNVKNRFAASVGITTVP